MDQHLVARVWVRARNVCEYCHLPVAYTDLPFEVDHVIARKHGGKTTFGNLALSCAHCNLYKGPNIAGLDPESSRTNPVKLFNPRRHKWHKHFRLYGPYLVGLTAIGRTTVRVLEMNDAHAVWERRQLIDEGVFPE